MYVEKREKMKSRIFGYLPDGRAVTAYELEGSQGAYAEILDYGATVLGIHVPDRDGILRDVTLGYDELASYTASDKFFGVTAGRCANRIGYGRFTLNGKTYTLDINSPPHHLHGGARGYQHRMFSARQHEGALILGLYSPDGDQGYPGSLELSVTFRFTPQNELHILYRGTTDQDTLLNLTNHSYFDLSWGQDPLGQSLWIDADRFAENDENTLPTGRLLPVKGTPFDFTVEKPLGRDIDLPDTQLIRCRGYDHNYQLNSGDGPCARLYSSSTGIAMTVKTDMPGMQVYSGNFIGGTKGKNGRVYRPHDGICLETQFFPNAMAIDGFEKPILRAGETYLHETVYGFSVN